jgi:hypothetical protein
MNCRQDLGPTKTPIQLVPEAIFQGVQLPGGREANHSDEISGKVKKTPIYISTSQYIFNMLHLINYAQGATSGMMTFC